MNKPVEKLLARAVDGIQLKLTDYAQKLRYEDLPAETVHTAKVRVIDTLGSLIGGFFADPCRIARDVAAAMPNDNGATVIGTRMKTTPEMAAYVNAATARYVEMNDIYHWPPERCADTDARGGRACQGERPRFHYRRRAGLRGLSEFFRCVQEHRHGF